MVMFSKFAAFTNRHPIVRGIIAYGTIWPISNVIQQTMAGKKPDSFELMQILRFAIFGAFYVAPTLYSWVRISSMIWPQSNLKTGILKAFVEQVTYGPFAIVSFHFGMSLLEGKTLDESIVAVKEKFLPTWQVGMCFWFFLQTINFTWVPERNRVPFVSCGSIVWCCFLSYMHQLNLERKGKEKKELLVS